MCKNNRRIGMMKRKSFAPLLHGCFSRGSLTISRLRFSRGESVFYAPFLSVLLTGVLTLTVSGAEISIVPVSADGSGERENSTLLCVAAGY